MTEPSVARMPKWPFVLGDLLMLCVAAWVILYAAPPLQPWAAIVCAACTGVGVWLMVTPFLLEYRAEMRQLEQAQLGTTLSQIQDLQQVAQQISRATALWQTVQEHAERTATLAKDLNERMSAETKEFCVFLERANDTQKAHLGLEVEKLRRAEAEWLQLTVHLLDHVHALHLAAVRSGKPQLISQLTQFQHACRDAVRRVGLVQFTATPRAPFDAQFHQLAEAQDPPPPNALVAETLAAGYKFQGKLLRRAVVNLLPSEAAETQASTSAETAPPTQTGKMPVPPKAEGQPAQEPGPTAPTEPTPPTQTGKMPVPLTEEAQ